MAEDNRLVKVEIFIQQNRFLEAEKVLSDLLSENPNDTQYLSLLAEVNLQQGKLDNAHVIINSAIGLSPDAPHLFYIKSRIAIQQGTLGEAEKFIHQAIDLDPYDADYFALLASIQLGRKRFNEALETANRALEIEAEHLLALNTRSTALNKLKRSEESFDTIEGALREDPNNAYTHANYGWGLLEKGDHKKSLEHFKEALKKDPTFEYAQAGMLEALKAANPVYRLFLKYAFWMSNLTSRYQWGVIIGFYIVIRVLNAVARNNEGLQPYLTPVIIGLALIAFSTWVIAPISNLFLRFNKYGQLLLDKKEKLSSNYVAASFGLFVAGLLAYFSLSDARFLPIAIFGFAMMVPFSAMFSPSKYKNALLIYAVVMAVVGLMAIGLTFATGDIFNTMTLVFVVGFVGFQWVANFLLIKEDNQ
ncbi:tetratricopeptide repeat protein [Geofilum rubicundum]|uniref:TPR repeat protein n=1 Tax=Geofilum rubicundum JCM 15548 TaxID=1236989 RepID=A0A0E9LWZ5_9BACT|nr:tetratricopeptide repeat protein [Geofilum rubicundum]GAO29651.1 TPR repeat protein [Geofilum rubicundum JCM 15548]